MERDRERFPDPFEHRASMTLKHIARSEQTMRRAEELLGRLHWNGSTLTAHMQRQEQLDWLALSTPAPSEVEAIPAPVYS